MVLFFQKKPAHKYQPGTPPQEYIPVDIVQKMASQGMPEPDIISQLRTQGFSPMQIDKALSQAIKSAVSTTPASVFSQAPRSAPPYQQYPSQTPQPSPSQTLPFQPYGAPPERIVPGPQVRTTIVPEELLPEAPPIDFNPPPQQEFTFEENPQQFAEKPDEIKTTGPEITLEEVIEGVIAERWQTFEKRINVFDQRSQQLNLKVDGLKRNIDDLRAIMAKSDQTFAGNLDEFNNRLAAMDARVKSIERAFKDFLPELTENVRTITDVVERLKKDETY
jgi:hypothetical protein